MIFAERHELLAASRSARDWPATRRLDLAPLEAAAIEALLVARTGMVLRKAVARRISMLSRGNPPVAVA